MKVFACLFTLYLFALSCMPCSDGEHAHEREANITSAGAVSFSSDEHGCPRHRHCNDLCSPFCSCHCCSVIFVIQKITPLTAAEKNELSNVRRVFPDTQVFIQETAFSIDHPPQLS